VRRRQNVWCRYREAPSLRRGLRPYHVQKERAGTWEVQPHPPERSPAGAASKGQPELTASRLEVGPAHSTDEAVEGNDMVEGRGRPAGTTLTSAKGQTQRWQPLLPNLQRVNAAALASGRTRFTALLHHVDVAALERAFRRQRRAASPGVDRVTMDQYEHDLEGNLQRLHAMVHSPSYSPHSRDSQLGMVQTAGIA